MLLAYSSAIPAQDATAQTASHPCAVRKSAARERERKRCLAVACIIMSVPLTPTNHRCAGSLLSCLRFSLVFYLLGHTNHCYSYWFLQASKQNRWDKTRQAASIDLRGPLRQHELGRSISNATWFEHKAWRLGVKRNGNLLMGSNMLPGYRNIQRTYKRNHVVPRTDDLMPQEQIPLIFLGFEARNVCFKGSPPVNRRHPAPADSQDIPPVFIYGFLISTSLEFFQASGQGLFEKTKKGRQECLTSRMCQSEQLNWWTATYLDVSTWFKICLVSTVCSVE